MSVTADELLQIQQTIRETMAPICKDVEENREAIRDNVKRITRLEIILSAIAGSGGLAGAVTGITKAMGLW